jgi:exodeoxyribonuclease V gamma subunit
MGKDDRYVFLEALLAARDIFYISYTGQSQQDNASLPPSVLVSELLDALETSSRIEGTGLKEHIVCKHYLQPFNANYFIPGSKVYSYSQQDCDCAHALQQGSTGGAGFFEQPLPPSQKTDLELSVDDLVRFFKNPSEYLLRERLNVSLEPRVFSITERESFQLDGLERYAIEKALLQEQFANPEAEASFEKCAARGILPHGAAGRAAYLRSRQSVRSFVCDLNRAGLHGATTEKRLFEITIDDCTLSSTISLSSGAGLVHMRYAAIKPIDFLRIWLEYLLCSAAEAEVPFAMLAGLDPKHRGRTQLWQFAPPDDPLVGLKRIIALYHEGQCSPLAFMPQASFAYAEVLSEGKTAQQARAAAAKTLEQDDYTRSDLDDACFGRFFDESLVVLPDFERCAREVFEPVFQHRQKKM